MAQPKEDRMVIEVLPDGMIRTTVDGISGVNHKNAESFLDVIAKEMGGEVERNKRKDAHHHGHGHTHTHAEQGGGGHGDHEH